MIDRFFNGYESCLLNVRVDYRTADEGALCPIADTANLLRFSPGLWELPFNASIDFWNCGTVETGADVITIVAMFTIVVINHNCRNTNHNCRKKNHNCRNANHNCRNLINHNCRNANHNCINFFEKSFDHVNIKTWFKDGVSLDFFNLNSIFHNIVAILPCENSQYTLVAYTLSAEAKFGIIFCASPQCMLLLYVGKRKISKKWNLLINWL